MREKHPGSGTVELIFGLTKPTEGSLTAKTDQIKGIELHQNLNFLFQSQTQSYYRIVDTEKAF
nr:hypothetical protein [uncultured Desulfobacter sp.]